MWVIERLLSHEIRSAYEDTPHIFEKPKVARSSRGRIFLAHSILLTCIWIVESIESLRSTKLHELLDNAVGLADFPLIFFYFVTSANVARWSLTSLLFMSFVVMGGFYAILGWAIGKNVLKKDELSKTRSNDRDSPPKPKVNS